MTRGKEEHTSRAGWAKVLYGRAHCKGEGEDNLVYYGCDGRVVVVVVLLLLLVIPRSRSRANGFSRVAQVTSPVGGHTLQPLLPTHLLRTVRFFTVLVPRVEWFYEVLENEHET